MTNVTVKPDFHTFRFSEALIASSFGEDCFQQVISTQAFRRLASIHFLGSIDYLLTGGHRGVEERQTRFDHSLAVAKLAKRFAEMKGAKHSEFQTIVVSALLHDIGHAPLSHSLEPAFRSHFEIDHHLVGEKILRGEVRIGLKLAKVLQKFGVNNFEVMALISGVGTGIGKELFSRAINVDTIEGIVRSASYVMRREVLVNPIAVIDALADLGRPSQDILDEFWMLKDRVYSALIQSRKGLVADLICKRYMELNASAFKPSYYYGTEKELRRDHRLLFEILDDFGRSDRISAKVIKDGENIEFVRRRFVIDAKVVLNTATDIDRRYLQTKERVVVQIRKKGGEDAHTVPVHPGMQTLF